MPSYTDISKPTTSYDSISEMLNLLLINSIDFLLINTEDKLGISKTGLDLYTSISKPTTTYNSIVKPT